MSIRGRFPWKSQPQVPVGIDWSNPLTKGLDFCAPLSPQSGLFDLVQNQRGTRTGMGTMAANENGLYYNFSTSNYLDFTSRPKNIGATTPFTIAWTQEPRSTTGFSTIININLGTPATHNSFLIYQTVTADSPARFTAGPRVAGGAHSWSASVDVLVNNRLDKFVLICAGGSQSITGSDYTLYRNGILMSRGGSVNFAANTAACFRIGALDNAGDPWEGIIGNVHIWSRVLTETEAISWSDNEFTCLQPLVDTRSRYGLYVAGAGGSLIKTVGGLAIASVKTIGGLPIGSMKTLGGLTNV